MLFIQIIKNSIFVRPDKPRKFPGENSSVLQTRRHNFGLVQHHRSVFHKVDINHFLLGQQNVLLHSGCHNSKLPKDMIQSSLHDSSVCQADQLYVETRVSCPDVGLGKMGLHQEFALFNPKMQQEFLLNMYGHCMHSESSLFPLTA